MLTPKHTQPHTSPDVDALLRDVLARFLKLVLAQNPQASVYS